MDRITIKYGDETFESESYWWEGNDFVFVTINGEHYRCVNTYPIQITFSDVDYSTSESCEIELTQRYE